MHPIHFTHPLCRRSFLFLRAHDLLQADWLRLHQLRVPLMLIHSLVWPAEVHLHVVIWRAQRLQADHVVALRLLRLQNLVGVLVPVPARHLALRRLLGLAL